MRPLHRNSRRSCYPPTLRLPTCRATSPKPPVPLPHLPSSRRPSRRPCHFAGTRRPLLRLRWGGGAYRIVRVRFRIVRVRLRRILPLHRSLEFKGSTIGCHARTFEQRRRHPRPRPRARIGRFASLARLFHPYQKSAELRVTPTTSRRCPTRRTGPTTPTSTRLRGRRRARERTRQLHRRDRLDPQLRRRAPHRPRRRTSHLGTARRRDGEGVLRRGGRRVHQRRPRPDLAVAQRGQLDPLGDARERPGRAGVHKGEWIIDVSTDEIKQVIAASTDSSDAALKQQSAFLMHALRADSDGAPSTHSEATAMGEPWPTSEAKELKNHANNGS